MVLFDISRRDNGICDISYTALAGDKAHGFKVRHVTWILHLSNSTPVIGNPPSMAPCMSEQLKGGRSRGGSLC